MKKEYPYLQNPYYQDINTANSKRNFLSKIDSFINQKRYVKITLLDWQEDPIKEIEGELVSGSLTQDGSSSVRKTCQFSASIDGNSYSIEDGSMDFSINKKIFLEIGIKNYTKEYPEYPILWFPKGIFFVSSFSASSATTSSVTLNITLKDKMCGLNGIVGGTFPSTVILDELDTQDASGQYVSKKVLIYNIIQELVHHFGGEDLNNIVIEDVPLRIKKIMKWTGSSPLYLIPHEGDTTPGANVSTLIWYEATIEKPDPMPSGTQTILNGMDVGYIFSDFIYTQELTATPGGTVCSVLDKIIQYLGNYEYFYDEFGIFHFREIKNYMNTTQGKIVLDDMSKNDYLVEVNSGMSVYSFTDNENLISISVNPQYENIKNDYVVQGLRKMTNTNVSYPIMYHLAIDKKPNTGNVYYDLLIYKETETELVKCAFPKKYDTMEELPQVGDFNIIYRVGEKSFYYWDENTYKEVNALVYYPPFGTNTTVISKETEEKDPLVIKEKYIVADWRTELYLQGLLARNNGTDAGAYYTKLNTDPNASKDTTWIADIFKEVKRNRIDVDFYFEELDAFWPQIYDLKEQKFIGESEDKSSLRAALTEGRYFLDFIDPSTSGLGEFSIANIGRRTNVTNKQEINCLFEPEIPDVVYINVDEPNSKELINECIIKNQNYTQVRGEVFAGLGLGGYNNAAFDQIKYDLYLHTTYQKSLSISALPVFYLEPNSRITINDKSTNTYGDFIAKTLSIPLNAGGTMSVSCVEAMNRF